MSFRLVTGSLIIAFFLLTVLFGSPSSVTVISTAAPARTPVPEAKPLFTDFKGVTIGMSADDARAKLGKAHDTSDLQDFYTFSAEETVQIVFDDDKTVKAIAATWVGTKVKAPEPKDVFGVDVEAKPDGSINKMVKYPKLGYWISYIRTEGSDPMIMVTVHKLQKAEL